MRCLTLMALLSMPCLADEIQTKDGKKIEFKSLVDEGDTIELTTPQGTKVSIKKSDFDKYIPSGVKEGPLTGAQFSFDKKRKLATVDLLAQVDVKRDGFQGSWKLQGGALVGSGSGVSGKLQSTYTPPEEYDLTLEVTRKAGTELAVGLVAGGHQCVFVFDYADCAASGPFIDQVGPATNGIGVLGKFFTNGKSRSIRFMVRKEALVCEVDGKDFLVWKADWKRAQLYPDYAVQSKNTVFLVVGGSTHQITKWTVAAPKE